MENEDKEIINAIIKIKEICEKMGETPCEECPFFSAVNNCCGFENSPSTWETKKSQVYTYFK